MAFVLALIRLEGDVHEEGWRSCGVRVAFVLLCANRERLHLAERHLRVWILVWGSTSASFRTADMSLP